MHRADQARAIGDAKQEMQIGAEEERGLIMYIESLVAAASGQLGMVVVGPVKMTTVNKASLRPVTVLGFQRLDFFIA